MGEMEIDFLSHRQAHVFEYLEALIRVANAKFDKIPQVGR
jgi:hypothetical protein